MNRKIEKILEQLYLFITQKHNTSNQEEQYENLTSYIFFSLLKAHLEDGKLRKEIQNVAVFQPLCLISALNYIAISPEDLASFLIWYYQTFFEFYNNPENEAKHKLICKMYVRSLNSYVFLHKLEKENLTVLNYDRIKEESYVATLNSSFSSYYQYTLGLKKNFALSEIGPFFLNSGLRRNLLDKAVEWECAHPILDVKKDNPKAKKPIKEKNGLSKAKASNKKTATEKQGNLLKRKQLQFFSTYFDIEKMRSKQYCDKEVYEQLFIIAKEWYPDLVGQIKKQILHYNKEIENGRYQVALERIYFNEPFKVSALLKLKQFCCQETIEPQYLGYIPTVTQYLDQIELCLDHFIATNDDGLIPDYYEYIEAIYRQVEVFLPYLPISFDKPIRN